MTIVLWYVLDTSSADNFLFCIDTSIWCYKDDVPHSLVDNYTTRVFVFKRD